MNQPYGNSPWGNQPAPPQQPQQQYGGYAPHGYPGPAGAPPPPHGYGPAPYGPPFRDPRLAQLDSDSGTWLIIALVGFCTGFGWITGPLAWIKGGALRRQYAQFGVPAHSSANGAWIVGIISTLLMVMAIVSFVAFALLWSTLLFAAS